MSAHRKAILALIIAHIIWGASTPIIKLTVATIPPFSLAVIRFWFTALILLFILGLRQGSLTITKSDRLPVLAWALLAVPVNIALFFVGINYTSAIDAAVISGLVPIFTAAAAFIFLREKLPKLNLAGLTTAFIGTLIIIGSPLLNIGAGDGARFFGNILNLISALAWVAGTLIAKDIIKRYSTLSLTTIAFVLGFFCLFPFAIFEYIANPDWVNHLTLSSYFGLAYTVIGNSILAYTLFNFALTRLSATAANTASYLMPIVGTALSIPLLGESLSPPFLLGSGVILVGILLAETRHSFHPLHQRLHKKE